MNYSNDINEVIDLSKEFALSLSSGTIETEHLIYGVLAQNKSASAKILCDLGVNEPAYKNIFFASKNNYVASEEITLSKSVEALLQEVSINDGSVDDLFLALLSNEKLKATKILKTIFKLDIEPIKEKLREQKRQKENEKEELSHIDYNEDLPEALKDLGFDLTKKLAAKGFSKIIGRDDETQRVIEILCRKSKNNPVLIGEPGVGKTSVVEGLAIRILEGNVPNLLLNKKIFSFDLASLMAGTKFRGAMEQKLKDAVEAILSDEDLLVFIDEIHMLAQAGAKDGEISPADILKPYLARGELHCIGATTLNEYKKYIEKDSALERRFQTVSVDEPSKDDAIKILKGIRPSYENFHNVKISDEAIISAVNLSVRYITSRFLPDKAIDLIDEACSKARLNTNSLSPEMKELNLKIAKLENDKKEFIKLQDYIKANNANDEIAKCKREILNFKQNQISKFGKSYAEISADDIKEVVSKWTKIPLSKITATEKEKLLNLENILSQKVIGQDGAIADISRAIRRAKADINDPNRPLGSFMFLGPTGTGKTQLAKAIGDVMFDGEDALVRFDMSEFMESHSVSRLIGAPPGYVGFEDGGELTEAVKRNPYCVVLFDEIEKAHPDIFNLLLQILDDGRLTDSSGKTINFKNTIIILTSNCGVKNLLDRRAFEKAHPEELKVDTKEFLMNKLKENFKLEFLNRIDSIVIFNELSIKAIIKIAEGMLSGLVKRLDDKEITLEFSSEAKILIAKKGYDKLNGARPLKRVIDKEIKDPLAEMMISGKLASGSAIKIGCDKEKFTFDILVG